MPPAFALAYIDILQDQVGATVASSTLAYMPPIPPIPLPRREDFPDDMPEPALNTLRALLKSMEHTQMYIESQQIFWRLARQMSEADAAHLYHVHVSQAVASESRVFPPPFPVPRESGL